MMIHGSRSHKTSEVPRFPVFRSLKARGGGFKVPRFGPRKLKRPLILTSLDHRKRVASVLPSADVIFSHYSFATLDLVSSYPYGAATPRYALILSE